MLRFKVRLGYSKTKYFSYIVELFYIDFNGFWIKNIFIDVIEYYE